MSEPIAQGNKQDVVVTGELRVACDGPAFSKHPRVFLTMVDDAQGRPTEVVCPYCSRVFKHDVSQAGGGHHH